ncbi:MAG: adenylosuccinate lyase family protein [Propioniciclava sp.]|uniref:class-II fumarase/aspartase family protein n=1 Tax=Propioniciclava sp. TaxID=2038686 RepID=UPI0039E6CC59
MNELFSPRAVRQRWLDVEAALAQAEAACGMVPDAAASAITAAARLDALDYDQIMAGERAAGHVMVPVVSALADAAGPEHGGWVHWGATTQNIQQTGNTVGLGEAHRRLVGQLERVLLVLADLAERHARTPMAGRTHGQHAVPITFGYKAAVWADVLARHLERMRQAEPRLLVALVGGAAGTFATFGADGPAIQDGVASRLGLGSMPIPSRAIADHFAEWIGILGLIAATAQSIAEEVIRLMSSEFGEVAESLPPGDVGSSTMPQKRNAKGSMDIVSAAIEARGLVPVALEATIHAHEVDGSRSAVMDRALERSAVLLDGILTRLEGVLSGLRINQERMAANLGLTGGMITAEAVMMRLAAVLGRQEAHTVVHHAAKHAALDGVDFADALREVPLIVDNLTPTEIDDLLDPLGHLGLSAELATQTAGRVRALVSAD